MLFEKARFVVDGINMGTLSRSVGCGPYGDYAFEIFLSSEHTT
jgi:hypothetical protein